MRKLTVRRRVGLAVCTSHLTNEEDVGAVDWASDREVGDVELLFGSDLAAQRSGLGKRNALLLGIGHGAHQGKSHEGDVLFVCKNL